jgi:hypothetical protein
MLNYEIYCADISEYFDYILKHNDDIESEANKSIQKKESSDKSYSEKIKNLRKSPMIEIKIKRLHYS